MASVKSVPVIDLHNDAAKVVAETTDACSNWGFFQVINHGIDIQFLAEVQEVARRFFQLPMEDKIPYAAKKFGLREDGYGKQEGLLNEAMREYLLLYTLPLELRNQENWPEFQDFKEKIATLSDEFLALAQKLLAILSQGLGLSTSYMEEKFGVAQQSFLVNVYPPCSDSEKVCGLPPHSDLGGLTLLLQSIPGLHVLKDDSWILVEPIPGAITVNVGDMIELLSNGRYKSVIHQVMMNKIHPRMSIASVYGSLFDRLISPSPELIDEEHPQLYKPVLFGDYMEKYVAVVKATGMSSKDCMLLQ